MLCCLGLSAITFAQDDLLKLWPDTVLHKANAALDVDYLSEQEKEVVFFINLVRINPPLFAETYLKDYLKANDIKKDKAIKELIAELESTSKMGILLPNRALTDFARQHAKDMGDSGRTGHSSSTGATFRERIEPLTPAFSAINENCNYGNEKGLDIVIDLLIDRNVPNAGHRKNILDSELTLIGTAIEPHKRWRFNCVQSFGVKL